MVVLDDGTTSYLYPCLKWYEMYWAKQLLNLGETAPSPTILDMGRTESGLDINFLNHLSVGQVKG
jgi:hypothetical protein